VKLVALLLVALALRPASVAGQGATCVPLTSVVVPERNYVQVNIPDFAQRVYVYVPDVKSGWRGGYSSFQLWIVEGVYGKPFVKASGAMEEGDFNTIRKSRNVNATAVPVGEKTSSQRASITVNNRRYTLELKVNTSIGGTDSVAVTVCR
jgi:hypothetical protein